MDHTNRPLAKLPAKAPRVYDRSHPAQATIENNHYRYICAPRIQIMHDVHLQPLGAVIY
jgi:hypothetical protein